MALNAAEVIGRGSGAAVSLGPVPDPDDWLGDLASEETLHLQDSQLLGESITAATTSLDRRVFEIAARNGEALNRFRNSWVSVRTGNNAGFLSKISSFDPAGNTTFVMRDRPPNDFQVGDLVFLYDPNNAFNEATAAECFTGIEDYRLIYLHPQTTLGANVDAIRCWIEPVESCGCTLEIVTQTASSATGIDLGQNISDRFDPFFDNQGIVTAGNNFVPHDQIRMPLDFLSGHPQTTVNLQPNHFFGIWLRRTIPARSRHKASAAFALRWLSTRAGGDPDPLEGVELLTFDLAGMDVEATVTRDRPVHVFGGARYDVQIHESNTQEPIADFPVFAEVSSGEGTISTDVPDFTDAEGNAGFTLTAPTDLAEEGETADVDILVPAGTES